MIRDKNLGNSLVPNRIFNAISIRSSRRLRNSLRSDMLADQKKGQSPFLLALKERTPMAKSSMVAAAISQILYLERSKSLSQICECFP